MGVSFIHQEIQLWKDLTYRVVAIPCHFSSNCSALTQTHECGEGVLHSQSSGSISERVLEKVKETDFKRWSGQLRKT